MIIGYIRIGQSLDDHQDEIVALEKEGCEHVFMDYGAAGPNPTLAAVLGDLAAGDALFVWSLDNIATSLNELISIIGELTRGRIRLRALSEEFDTQGSTAVVKLIKRLQDFQARSAARSAPRESSVRVGRPRALSEDDVRQATSLLNEGKPLDIVAQMFGVTRPTLQRYLTEIQDESYPGRSGYFELTASNSVAAEKTKLQRTGT